MIAMLILSMAMEVAAPLEPVTEPPPAPAAVRDHIPNSPIGTSGPMPRSNPGSWVTSQDYPKSELDHRTGGMTSFTLAIDQEGMVIDCIVTQSSGSTVLDATACALVKARGQFTPAHDANGHNTVGFYSNRVRWVVPAIEYQSLPDGKWDVTTTVFVGDSGIIESCDFASAGNEIANGARGFTPCTAYVVGRFMRAYKNSAGKPLRYHVIFHVTTEVVPD